MGRVLAEEKERPAILDRNELAELARLPKLSQPLLPAGRQNAALHESELVALGELSEMPVTRSEV
jgi:hypothetical protein